MFKGIKFRKTESKPVAVTVSLDVDSYTDLNYAAAAALRAKFSGNQSVYRILRSKVTQALSTRHPSEPDSQKVTDLLRAEARISSEDYSNFFSSSLSKGKIEGKKHHASDVMTGCDKCEGNQQTMVQLKGNYYIALPNYHPLTLGHCLIVPVTHVLSVTELEEDLYRELMDLQRDVNSLYREKLGCSGLFIENAIDLETCKHTYIECFPLPIEVQDTAPLYYQKELSEAGYEWTDNPKVTSTRGRSVQTAVPKGFPYVHVDFNCEGGLVHVVQSRRHFRTLLAVEIARDLLGADPLAFSRKLTQESARSESEKLQSFLN